MTDYLLAERLTPDGPDFRWPSADTAEPYISVQ
jgi:hypothetical protein